MSLSIRAPLAAFLLAPLFLAAIGGHEPAHAQPGGAGREAVEGLEAEKESRRLELEALQEVLDGERERLQRVKKRENSVLDLLEESEIALGKLSRERAGLEGRIADLEQGIAVARAQLATERKRLTAKRESLGRRLVGLYKLGSAGSLRLLLASSSIAEFQRRRHSLGVLLQEDNARVAEFQESVSRLEALEISLQSQREELGGRREELERNRAKALSERENRLRVVRAVRQQRENYEQAVSELQGQSEQLEQMVGLIERRIRGQRLLLVPKDGVRRALADFKGSLLPPVPGPLLARFGRQVSERFATVTFNNGIEIGAAPGTPVQAVFGGAVVFAERFKGYGNLIIIDHGEGYYSVYAHCDRLRKAAGDPVEAREVVAWVGESGLQEGPSCYFEIRHHGKAVDPLDWLLPQ